MIVDKELGQNAMIEKIYNNQIQDFLEKPSSEQSNSAGALPDNDVDASLQVDYASFIDMAAQVQQTDAKAVQLAQELLLSGQLETPENIRAAAENIAELGV